MTRPRRQALHARGPIRRSPPARCSRRPTASTASPPGTRCRWPRACTRTATSPTCEPTRPTWPRWRSRRPAIWSRSQYGREYLPDQPRIYQTKVKNAQEAHEAIRPAGHPFELPESLRGELTPDEFRLYDLIWKRTIASQMADARGRRITITVEGDGARVPGQRQDDRVSRLSAGVRRRLRRSRGRAGRPRDGAAAGARGRAARLPRPGAQEPHHAAAQPLQRSLADPGAGRNGHRPAEHLRLDHRHDPGPRVRLQVKRGNVLVPTWTAFAVVAVARRRICPTWSTTSSPPRWKTNWTRSAAAKLSHVEYLQRVLLRQRASGPEAAAARQGRRDRRPRRQPHLASAQPRGPARDGLRPRGPLRAVPGAGRAPGEPARRACRPTN